MTDSERLEQILKANSQRTSIIEELTSRDFKDRQDLLDFALNRLVTLLDSKVGYIYYYDEETEIFTLYSWSDSVMANCGIMQPQTRYELSKTGCWGDVVRTKAPVIINDFPTNPHRKGYPDGHVPILRFLGVPVHYNGHIVATAAVANADRDYTQFDVEQLLEFMNVVWSLAEYKAREFQIMQVTQALRHVQEIAAIGGWELNLKTNTFDASIGAARIYGLAPGELSKDLVQHAVFNPEQRKQNDTALVDIIKNNATYDLRFQIKRPDGTIRDIHSIATYDPQTEVVTGVIQDETEWNNVMQALRTSEEMYRNIINNSPMGMHYYKLEDDGRLIFAGANPAADVLLGFDHKPLFGKEITEAFPGHRPETGSKIPQLYTDIASGKIPLQIERIAYKDDTAHLDGVYDIYAFQISTGMCTVMFLDVTEQVKQNRILQDTLTERETLLREIHHRVKNNLQIIASILNLEQDTLPDDTATSRVLENMKVRVRSMALVHEYLYNADSLAKIYLDEYLRGLSAIATDILFKEGTIFEYKELEHLQVNIDVATPLGLIVTEVVTNSIRHGATTNSIISMSLVSHIDADRTIVKLTLRDNGLGFPEQMDEGLGYQLVTALTRQLGGTLERWNDNGANICIQFPLRY